MRKPTPAAGESATVAAWASGAAVASAVAMEARPAQEEAEHERRGSGLSMEVYWRGAGPGHSGQRRGRLRSQDFDFRGMTRDSGVDEKENLACQPGASVKSTRPRPQTALERASKQRERQDENEEG